MSYHGLGTDYDRRPPGDPSQYVGCATQAQHDAAHAACKPLVLRGLGLLDLPTTFPCWVETLPICPPPVDWVALAKYAAAVKAANDKRAADLVAYAQYMKAEKDRQDMLAYAAAVQAANDKKAADLVAYAAYLKAHAAQPAGTPPPPPPPAPPPPVPRPPVVMRYVPPPPPPPPSPTPLLEPAHASAEVQAGMGAAAKVGIGLAVSALALVGYVVFFKPKKARAA